MGNKVTFDYSKAANVIREEEVAAIFAGVRGFLDSVELSQIAEFEQRALQSLCKRKGVGVDF